MIHLSLRRVLLIAALILVTASIVAYRLLFAGLPDPERSLGSSGAQSILITDRNGRLLYEVIDPNGSKQVPVPLSDIPLACRQATLATEDSRFYLHPGVDPLAMLRAVWLNWREGRTVSGGSTLTQQLARNLFLSQQERNERSLRRKLREAWLAWRLERTYSKDQILTLYLNTTYYGHFAVGIEAAAQAYFGMHARELDLAQCALLAGLPQFPSGYNPIENPQAAGRRQEVVLDLMVKDHALSAEQAADAHKESMAFVSTPFPIQAPHFVMWVQGQVEQMLGAERWRAGGLRVITTLDLDWQHQAEATVNRRLAQLRPCPSGGDPRAAGPAGGAQCDPSASPARRVDDAAVVALDPQTGAVRAMVGSADYFDRAISGAVNAALSLRQPGSAIKPLTYAAALDPARAAAAGHAPWTPATLVADVRTVFPTQEGKPYAPQDYDLRFHGPVTVRAALANSYNVPAVKALQYIGVEALIDQAARQGINWVANLGFRPAYGAAASAPDPTGGAGRPWIQVENPQSFGLALTLGGGEVRLLDLTAAYAAFANGGRRVTPYAIERIETLAGDHVPAAPAGEPVEETTGSRPAGSGGQEGGATPARAAPARATPARAVDPRVAYLITDMLSDGDARLPAFGPGNVLDIGRPAAAKTGTTTDWRDNWTLGYTPDLAAGVWVGNADNTPMLDISGISGAGPIWHDFMVNVLRNVPARQFARPDWLVQVEVCADSGLLPGVERDWASRAAKSGAGAPSGAAARSGGAFATATAATRTVSPAAAPCPARRPEWFIAGTEPQAVDRAHLQVPIDVRTGQPASEVTPADALGYQMVWALPAEYQAWARENGIAQPAGLATADLADVGTAPGGSGPAGQPAGLLSRAPAPLALASPDPNRSYKLDPGLPAEAQKLPVTAMPGRELLGEGSAITLLLDGSPFATVAGPDYTAWWQLATGEHTFQAAGRRADGTQVTSPVVSIYVEP